MGLATVTGICTKEYGCVIGEIGVHNQVRILLKWCGLVAKVVVVAVVVTAIDLVVTKAVDIFVVIEFADVLVTIIKVGDALVATDVAAITVFDLAVVKVVDVLIAETVKLVLSKNFINYN